MSICAAQSAEKNNIGIITGAIISGIGMGIKMSIYFSMQADPVDYGIWKTARGIMLEVYRLLMVL